MRKIHVAINDGSFFTSANAITRGVGRSNEINMLVQRGFAELIKNNAINGSDSVTCSDMDGRKIQVEFI